MNKATEKLCSLLNETETKYSGTNPPTSLPNRNIQFNAKSGALILKNKIKSLYDFQQLGLEALRKPELEKINALEDAINSKKLVNLIGYRSNSNEIRNRTVECFIVDSEHSTIQVYDINKLDIGHFKLNRIERVEILGEKWKYEKSMGGGRYSHLHLTGIMRFVRRKY